VPFTDLYPSGLKTERSPERLPDADEVVYRLILKRLAIPGLPELLGVGDVEIHFTVGPVRTQCTESRQRPGLPFVFDKHMRRAVLVGDNEPLTVCQLRRPLLKDVGAAAREWRARVETAVGLVAATLDERIAGSLLTEDLIFLQAGRPVAAADVHSQVRTYMPFDVTDADRLALEQLRGQDLSLDRDVARAAHFYRTATREGPTREGFLLLWLAVDSLVGTRKTQKQAVASRLAEIDFDLDWLMLPLGRLVGLRGNIAHGRVDDPEFLRQGYYDTEAIARGLIRADAAISAGWPAMPTATAFPLPLGRQISDAQGRWVEEWHDDGLPRPDDEPAPTGLRRLNAVLGEHAEWLKIERAEDDDTARRLRFWAMAAVQAVGIDVETLSVRIDRDGELPDAIDMATNAEQIRVSPALANPGSDVDEARLAYFLCRAVAELHIMRLGITSTGFGAFLIELGGAWAGYREWVVGNELPRELLHRGPLNEASLQDLGAYVGIALAGDSERQKTVSAWLEDDEVDPDLRSTVAQTIEHLRDAGTFAEVLAFMNDLAAETRRLTDPQ
jgi:hypothetical protein